MSCFTRRQRELTITMGVTCIFTMVLYVVPTTILTVVDLVNSRELFGEVTLYRTVSVNASSLVNTLIIVCRQKDIIEALKKLLPFYVRFKMRKSVASISVKSFIRQTPII